MQTFYESRINDKEIQLFEIDKKFGKHYHCGVEINYCLEDGMQFSLNEQTLTLNQGDVLFIDSFDIHSNNDGKMLCLIIPEIFLGDFKQAQKGMKAKKQYFSDKNEKILKIIKNIGENKHSNLLKLGGLINILLGEILDRTLLDKEFQKKNPLILREILEYIDKHLDEKISLEKLAKAIGYSKSHVSHVLAQNIGPDLRTYLNKLRLSKFISLKTANNKISSTAKACGFDSMETFYRNFKKEYGCSPLKYFNLKTIKRPEKI